MTTLPTYEQVLDLPASAKRDVPEDYIDENGHMNIGRYLELASRASWEVTSEAGMGDSYIERRGRSVFTVEQHLRYFAELRLGDELSVHVRLLGRSDKTLHSVTFIVDRTRRRLVFTCELMLVHVDMGTRRTASFPDDIAAGLDAVIEAHSLPWPAPVSGSMGVRRR